MNLSTKIGKVSRKDLVNRYFVSGIKTILNLIQSSEDGGKDQELISHLEEIYRDFQDKILEYLENIEEYEVAVNEFKLDESPEMKRRIARKIYKILKNKNIKGHEKMQKDLMEMSIEKTHNLFSQENPSVNEFFISLAS